MAYFGANKSPQQLGSLLLFNSKEGEREEDEKTNREKKTPGITMATCSSLMLLTVPIPHLSVTLDQAMVTVGITMCYKCWMLIKRGCALEQGASSLRLSGMQVAPWAAFPLVAVWVWEVGPFPLPCQALVCLMGSVGLSAASLPATSFTFPLLLINPPFAQGKTL